jgi:hypothetical protein
MFFLLSIVRSKHTNHRVDKDGPTWVLRSGDFASREEKLLARLQDG